MKVLFIGGIYPPHEESKIRANSKVGLDNASNNLQFAIIEGLQQFYTDLTVVSMTPVMTFPRGYKKLFLRDSKFKDDNETHFYCIGFLNIFLLKHLSIYFNLKKKLKELTASNEEIIIINYGLDSPKLKVVSDLRRKNSRIKCCLIVPDLPQYMSERGNLIFNTLKSIDSSIINYYFKNFGFFVLLSKYMYSKLPIFEKPWVVVEGIYNLPILDINIEKDKEKVILYTGNLGERSGVRDLIQAFQSIKNKNYWLWIRGDGPLKKYVLDLIKSGSRIKYFDEMSLLDLHRLLNQATVLINPVSPNSEFSKFFFPSKLMNYLASGTPTITFKLECIPDEYYKYCFVPISQDELGLRQTMLDVLEMSNVELESFGKRAMDFIEKNKGSKMQVQKIINLISSK
jgi:glycosyltransferase involved in cell wall biosynthesis